MPRISANLSSSLVALSDPSSVLVWRWNVPTNFWLPSLGRCFTDQAANVRVLWYTIASEIAASGPLVSGPGTFLSAFVDEMHRLSSDDYEWISKGRLSPWKG